MKLKIEPGIVATILRKYNTLLKHRSEILQGCRKLHKPEITHTIYSPCASDFNSELGIVRLAPSNYCTLATLTQSTHECPTAM